MIWYRIDKEFVCYESKEIADLDFYPSPIDIEEAREEGMAWISSEDYKRLMSMFGEGLIELLEEEKEEEEECELEINEDEESNEDSEED